MTALLLAGISLAACGEPARNHNPITLTGNLHGVYRPGAPGSCGPGDTTVVGLIVNGASKDLTEMTVNDNGHLLLDAGGRLGKYTGQGVAFHEGSGWDLDADLTSETYQSAHISGHLDC